MADTKELASVCKWAKDKSGAPSPHNCVPRRPRGKILNTILEAIGDTPLVRIHTISKNEGVKCQLMAKCEYFNSGGSVKDRIGRQMIEDAERAGRIKPGDILIEPTSGNTGIGLALAAAIKGYRMIITLPEKMSQEKVDVLKALGAEIIRTPTEAAFDSPDSHIGVAKRLNKELANSHILDQYANPSNPMAHYLTTAEELLEQTDGKIDYVVMSAGTGGTITGVARKLKEKIPGVKVIGVDPVGSILAQPDSLNGEITSYKVEGIGYDFIPRVLDRSLVDEWIKTEDKESFIMARRLIREEGLLAGGSAGATMWAAVQFCKQKNLGPEKRVVVLLADSVRNYMTKHLNTEWMKENGYLPFAVEHGKSDWWRAHKISDLRLTLPMCVQPDVTCGETLKILKEHGFDQMPVVGDNHEVVGVVTIGNLSSYIINGRVQPGDPVSKACFKQFKNVTLDTTLDELSHYFNKVC
uniref:Cystathionine beta-synthase n=1 Tax=Lotharella oceanica TaxID=641309 RepID=A0A7S2XCH6_9EUKA|mmetsp:Transcript_28925/g.54157  ORF Transcript_28925/g.54157 Transcript_28925/m.54157 type:complete len:468 (+) Transcript_28925:50-1453(+)